MSGPIAHDSARDLVLSRLIPAPPERVYAAWTQPARLERWFAPHPWTTAHAELDVRPGGINRVVMRDPDGAQYPNQGVYLEVVPERRLVFTDAYTSAWVPSEKPFLTVILNFAAEGEGTRYTVQVRHWTRADREVHEAMGFHQGWRQCTDQLVALLQGE